MSIQKILEKIVLYGLLAVPLIPLVFTNQLFFPFISPRGFYFRIVVEIIFATWILLALTEPKYRPRGSLILYALSVFTAVIFIADLFGVSASRSFWSNFERMEGFITLAHLFGYFLVAGAVLKELDWGKFFRISISVSFFVSLYSLLQLFKELPINQGGVRVDGTFGNALYLAAYLLLHIFLILFFVFSRRFKSERGLFWAAGTGLGIFLVFYLYRLTGENFGIHLEGGLLALISLLGLVGLIFLYKKRDWPLSERIERYFFIGLAFLEAIILFYTATRGAFLGLIGGLIVTAGLLAFFSIKNGNKIIKKVSLGALAGAALFIALFFFLRDTNLVRSNPVLGRLASISIEDDDAKARFAVWNIALQGFKERPVLGFGQDNFNYVFNKYYDPSLYKREQWFDRAHNAYLDWLTAGGVAGFLSYLSIALAAVLSLQLFNFRRAALFERLSAWWKNNPAFNYKEKAIIFGLFAGYAIHNFFAFDILPTYFVVFSLLAFLHFKSSEGQENLFVRGGIFPLKIGTMGAACLLLIAVVYFLNIRPIIAGATLIEAIHLQPAGPTKNYEYFVKALSRKSFASAEIREQLTAAATSMRKAQNVPDDLREDFINLSLSELKKQIEERPTDARYYLMLGVFLDEYSRFAEGMPYLMRADELSPNKQEIVIEIGTNYLNQQKFDEALVYFKKAFDLAPEFEDVRIIYAVGAIYAGKDKLAEELLVPVYGTTLIPDQRIARAYFNRGELAKVVALWERAVKEQPEDGERYLYLAGAYLESGRKASALAALKKAAEVSPQLKTQVDSYIQEIEKM